MIAENKKKKIALVTGGNRGLGFETCRQLAQLGMSVILSAQDISKGEKAAKQLSDIGLDVVFYQLDVSKQIIQQFTRLDVLVNNAAILYDTWQNAINADLEIVNQAIITNLFGPWRLSQICIPIMKRNKYGRIVNVSSGAGSLHYMNGGGGGTPAYSVSKAALNALTRILAAELRGTGILVNAVCPGWVATDMGGPGGRPVREGAASVLWAVDLPDDGPTGGVFRGGRG